MCNLFGPKVLTFDMHHAAGLTSLENYFQKGELLGQKAELNLWYVDTRPNLQKLFPSI